MINRRPYNAALLALCLLVPIYAQHQMNVLLTPVLQQQPSPREEEEEEVVRITTNRVQVDAIVTNKNGQHVTDLGPQDFELLEDGKKQEITNFSYVNIATDAPAQLASNPADIIKKGETAFPTTQPKPNRRRRTVALVIDDLSLSLESTRIVRRALKKYLDDQLVNGEMSAILRTSSGVGSLQQFTSDKRLLHAAVERVRWHPRSRGGLSAVEPTNPLNDLLAANHEGVDGDKGATPEETQQENSIRDTISSLTYIVRGLQRIPGRKALVVFTDALPILDRANRISNAERFRRLIDLANRSSVVFYTVDARGLQTFNPTAADKFTKPHGSVAAQVGVGSLRQNYFEAQDGMNYLARETGGIFFRERNDLNKGLQTVLEDQKGYYLIAYRPDDSTFDAQTGKRQFRELKVRVKRPGLSVRSRSGFYGVVEPKADEKQLTIKQQLLDALSSPFGAAGVDLRLAALFVNDHTRGSAICSIIHVSARDLVFTEGADGMRRAAIDVAAVVFNSHGHPSVQGTDRQEIVVREQEFGRISKNGLTYRLNIPVARPGAYNLRIAVRDAASGSTGSASEFILVPDLAKGPLALSGIALRGVAHTHDGTAMSQRLLNDTEGVVAEEDDPSLSPAVRRLRHGVLMEYGYFIYNARLDRKTGRPRLTTQVRLFRDGQLVFTGNLTPQEVGDQTDMKRLVGGGRLQIGTELAPGNYILQVIVTDTLVSGKGQVGRRTATQWVDFEVVG